MPVLHAFFPRLVKWMTGLATFMVAVAGPSATAAQGFLDPLETPAQMRTNPQTRSQMALAVVPGGRLISVGSRGMVLISDDAGQSWSQAAVPVQSDLLSVRFVTEKDGWIVGHEGVVLRTSDGGKTWKKQLDGRSAEKLFKAFYANKGDAGVAALKQLETNYKAGPALPMLDVWFEDAMNGFAVGPFGMLLATIDGGATWQPWLDRIDNPGYLNLNAIRAIGKDIFIVGERGQIYRLERNKKYFERTDTGYAGSFFGLVSSDTAIVAFGLRGTVYRSLDAGKTWKPVPVPTEQTISAGAGTADGRGFLLGSVAGELLSGDASGAEFSVITPTVPNRLTGIAVLADGTRVMVGIGGVTRLGVAPKVSSFK